ncbi:MAG TPA: trypsin-like peptidase domain-containing protein [Candidatus Limnocylindrales bacterium]
MPTNGGRQVTDGWAFRYRPDGERVARDELPAAPPASHWWSDALNDPWRDPSTPTVVTSPAKPENPPSPQQLPSAMSSRRAWWLVGVVGAVAAVLAGLLGGALGVRFGDDEPGGVNTVIGARPVAPMPVPDSLAGVAQAVLPSVVTIRVPVDGGTSLGSGFVASEHGHVITNDHVVAGGSGAATIIFDDGSVAQAELVGTDMESDVAVLKVLHRKNFAVAQLGDSDYVSVGDQVIAVGSPLALRGTVTAGIVSAIDRPIATGSITGGTRYYAAIQTDAAVNHGNSGGPLVDAGGQVVGINAVIKSLAVDEESAGNIGLAFAIPINHARRVANEIIETGRAHRSVIGAELEDTARGMAGGVRLREVVASGPAESAGLRSGDVVMTYNSRPLSEPTDLIALVRKTAPGEVVPVTYKRGPTSHNVEIKVAADPE